ncbi:hypothetical protein BC830DRAFT_1175447 [Chytriomyces sp. MP71]|nr:hypothetical protein BC830DRAFT_1175447 [Chytriomyces sp. MP71]
MFHKTRHTNLSENKISDHLTLETLPTEIHDHTAGYIPGSSMIHLATAIPHYKHIGAAIFRVNARHLRKEWTLGLADTLWPNPHLVYRIPVQHHAYIVTLLDLAHRSGGTLVLCPGNAKVAQTALDLAPAYMPVHLRMQTIRFEGIQSLLDVVMGLRQPVLSMEWPKNWWQSDVMKQLSKLHGAKELRTGSTI